MLSHTRSSVSHNHTKAVATCSQRLPFLLLTVFETLDGVFLFDHLHSKLQDPRIMQTVAALLGVSKNDYEGIYALCLLF